MYVPLKTLKVWLRLVEKVRANKFLLNWKGYFWCLPFCRQTLNICKFQSVNQTTRMLVESCRLNFWTQVNQAPIIIDREKSNKKKDISADIDIQQLLLHTCPRRISFDCMPVTTHCTVPTFSNHRRKTNYQSLVAVVKCHNCSITPQELLHFMYKTYHINPSSASSKKVLKQYFHSTYHPIAYRVPHTVPFSDNIKHIVSIPCWHIS